MSSALFALGGACHRHRRRVVTIWLLLLVLLAASAVLVGRGTTEDYAIPGSESQQTLDDLRVRFPEVAGTSAQIVAVAAEGSAITAPGPRSAISAAVAVLERVDGVTSVTDPFAGTVSGALSDDGRAAVITVQLAGDSESVPAQTPEAISAQAATLREAGLQAAAGGALYAGAAPAMSWIEAVGLLAAAVVLFGFFGTVRAAAAPVATALAAAGTTGVLLMIATAVVPLTGTAPLLALMICVAVGIDYTLFLLARHREYLGAGLAGQEAAARATATAGSAVVFAGCTVVTALLGLVIVGLPFLSAMGMAAALGVAVAVAAALTLGPAFMGLVEPSLRRSTARRARACPRWWRRRPGGRKIRGRGVTPPEAGVAPRRTWARAWVDVVTARPIVTVVLLTGLLCFAAVPAKDLRLALPDNGTQAPATGARRAYDLVERHFGPGQNGPLLLVADIVTSTDPLGAVDRLAAAAERVPGVDRVALATPNRTADTGVVVLVPTTGPSDPATADLVERLREEAPTLGAADDVPVRVAGQTAAQIDVSERLGAALLPFGIVVMGLSLLLLLVVFRSLVVPFTATVGFLLSVAAAFGIVTAVFGWGWLAGPLHVARVGPVISFMPIIVIGVLFGLAMDYQMFIVSRMHEHYRRHRDAAEAVRAGFESGAPVVAAAAVIMVAVFAAFVPEGDASLKPIALGLAVGVLLDAVVVRMMLVPAALHLFGHASWSLPAALRDRLPHLDIEGHGIERQIDAAAAIAQQPDRVVHARGVGASGPPGTAFTGLDLDVRRGQLCVLLAPPGGAATAALLTLAGRMRFAAGHLDVAGVVLPEQARLARHRVALAEFPGVNDLDDDLDVRHHVAERLATRTLLPWAPRRLAEAVTARIGTACGVATRGEAAAHVPGAQFEPARLVRDLTHLQRAVVGVVLAGADDPGVIVVDDLDALRTSAERAGLWAVLGWLASSEGLSGGPPPAVIAACHEPPAAAELAHVTGLPLDRVQVVPLAAHGPRVREPGPPPHGPSPAVTAAAATQATATQPTTASAPTR